MPRISPIRCRKAGAIAGILVWASAAVWLGACGHKAKVPTPTRTAKAPAQKTVPPAPPPRTTNTTPDRIPPPPAPETRRPEAVSPSVPAHAPSVTTGPLIRIGLTTTAREARISSSGRFTLLEKVPETRRRTIEGEITVRVEHESERSSERFRVQAGSFKSRDSAEVLAARLRDSFSMPVSVHENGDAGLNQVRIGSFKTREEAQSFATGPLAKAGYKDVIIVRENQAIEGGKSKLALRGRNLLLLSDTGFLLQPARDSTFLELDGKSYRGQLDLLFNKNGLITVVNQLGVEEYLLGVVPAEMSPSAYPQDAALAAQAVAARTYALKNMGRFAADGFDLTADNRTQVYGGVSQEREPASTAVRETAGTAIYYEGSLIEAMYASTCGGRTEDFANVFDSAPVPYLRSVICLPESTALESPGQNLDGAHPLETPVFSDDGSVANRNLELAQILGIVGTEEMSEEYLTGSPDRDEVRRWIGRAASLGGKRAERSVDDGDVVVRGGFIRYAADSLLASNEIERRVTAKDAEYYLANLKDGGEIKESDRRAFGFVLQAGLWRPYPDNSARPLEKIRRADALAHLVALVEYSRPEILRAGTFEASQPQQAGEQTGTTVAVKWGNRSQQFPLAGRLRLFKISGNRSMPAESLRLIGNEKIRFHLGRESVIDFLEVELNPAGASSDRFSPVAVWQVTISRSAAAEKLRSLAGNIGEFRDMKPAKLGVSGRAVKIEVLGSKRSVVLNGYRVRNALGLRDTLFTIKRAYDPAGQIESFTFNGRGWGHGIGLCQVGAYGMARSGSSYEEILKTYYRGVELRKAY